MIESGLAFFFFGVLWNKFGGGGESGLMVGVEGHYQQATAAGSGKVMGGGGHQLGLR